MKLDDNPQMVAMLDNAKGSLENKIRQAYNSGYNDGFKAGVFEAWDDMRKQLDKSLRQTVEQTEPKLTPNYCGSCKHREVPCGDLPCDVCHNYSNYEPKTEPQTFDKPIKCLGCLYSDLDKAFHPCASCENFSKYIGEVSGKTEPQTNADRKTEPQTLDQVKADLEKRASWSKTYEAMCKDEPNCSEIPNNCEELNAYRECIKSRSFWDSKHCDGCYFDERCPFDEPKDEPQTDCAWK